MYVNPFWAGVMSALFCEFVIVIVAACIGMGGKK